MGECRTGQTCEVPTKQLEGNRREWQGLNKVQVAEQVQVAGGTFRPWKGLLRPFHPSFLLPPPPGPKSHRRHCS